MITIASIKAAVADHYGIQVAALEAPCRARKVARPRQVAMYLARQLGTASRRQIGDRFGERDSSTVLHAERLIMTLLPHNAELRRDVIQICRVVVGVVSEPY